MWIAAFNGQRTMVEWLTVVAGAEADAVNKSKWGKSALHVAAENGHPGFRAVQMHPVRNFTKKPSQEMKPDDLLYCVICPPESIWLGHRAQF